MKTSDATKIFLIRIPGVKTPGYKCYGPLDLFLSDYIYPELEARNYFVDTRLIKIIRVD